MSLSFPWVNQSDHNVIILSIVTVAVSRVSVGCGVRIRKELDP